MTNANYNHSDIADQIAKRREAAEKQQEEYEAGFTSTFIKLEAGDNTIRFLPSPEGEPLIVEFRQHSWESPKFSTGLDLEWLHKDDNATLLAIAKRIGKLEDRDSDLFAQYGDPITAIARGGIKAGIDKKVVSKFSCWPTTRYYFRVVRREDKEPRVGILEQGQALYNKLFGNVRTEGDFGAYGKVPAMFNPDDGFDCEYNGNGEAKKLRRYPTLFVQRESSEVGIENWDEQLSELGDIVELMVKMNAVGWETKARAALTHKADIGRVNLALAENGEDLLPVAAWAENLTEEED